MGQRARIFTEILCFDGWKVTDTFFETAAGERVRPVRGFALIRDTRLVLSVERRWLPRCSKCGGPCRALAVRTALDKGHRVTAFARNPQNLALEHPQLRRVPGDFHQAGSVEAAVPGHDAVIVTASATRLGAFEENPRYFSQGTGYTIEAMTKAGVQRLVVLSALGVGESRPLLNSVVRALVVDLLLWVPFEEHERQEAEVRAGGLDWVVARPGRLTNGAARRRYVKKTSIESVPGAISRADVADFLVQACEVSTWVGHAVQLGG